MPLNRVEEVNVYGSTRVGSGFVVDADLAAQAHYLATPRHFSLHPVHAIVTQGARMRACVRECLCVCVRVCVCVSVCKYVRYTLYHMKPFDDLHGSTYDERTRARTRARTHAHSHSHVPIHVYARTCVYTQAHMHLH